MRDDTHISKPAYWTLSLHALGFAIGIALISVTPEPLSAGFVGLIMFVNVFQMLGLVWGFEIAGDTVRVSFPLLPSRNRSFSRVDVMKAQVVRNPIRIFGYADYARIRLTDGKQLVLLRIGTSRFQMFADFLETQEDNSLDLAGMTPV